MLDSVASQARSAAAGMAALLAAGDLDEADLLMQLYLRQTALDGVPPLTALIVLTKTVVSMAVAVAGAQAADHFAGLATKVQLVDHEES